MVLVLGLLDIFFIRRLLRMMSFLKLKSCVINTIKNLCNHFKLFMASFGRKKLFFLFTFLFSLCTFFFIFNEELVKFMLGDFESTQNFFQTVNGFDSNKFSGKGELSDQEKHIRKVNAALDHQIKTAEEARYFAQEREKDPEFQKFLKDHALVLNVFAFVFCWMVIFNTIAHMPPSSPPSPPK